MTQRFIILMAAALTVVGCTKQVIHEEYTPRGSVPPPALSHRTVGEVPAPRAATAARPVREAPDRATGSAPSEWMGTPDAAPEAVAEFREAYGAAGSPKLVVYLNRELSADVREWRTDSRLVVSGTGRFSAEAGAASGSAGLSHTGVEGDIAAVGAAVEAEAEGEGATVAEQRHNASPERVHPGEAWMWVFEEGFINALLDSGAIVIDRATILRDTATSAPGDDRFNPASVKMIEMEALREHADVLIELLVSPSSASPYGYEFRASAKEIATGRILANVTSIPKHRDEGIYVTERGFERREDDGLPRRREVVETPSGFELRDEIPTVHEASTSLAEQLTDTLARRWADGE